MGVRFFKNPAEISSLFRLLLVSVCAFGLSARADDISLPSDISPELSTKYNEGVELLNAGKGSAAAEKFSDVVKGLPSSPAAHMAYAAALETSGNMKDAISEFENAASLKPDHDELLYNLGRVYQISGDRDRAIRQWERYLWLYRDGRHAAYVKEALPMLKNEQSTASVFADSKGRDDYLEETLSKGALRWKLDKMPVSVYINNGAGVPAYKPAYDLLVRQCFADWESATEGKLRFKPVDTAEQAQIEVKWTGNPANFGNSTEAGEARPQSNGNNLYHVDILLCTKGLNGGPVIGLKATCLHEIGHSLGLLGHSSNRGDIMFMMSRGENEAEVLSARDINTARLLYGLSDAQLSSYNKYVHNDSPFLHGGSSSYERMRAYYADGNTAFKAGRYLEAAVEWEHALEIKPYNVNFKINIGNAYMLQARQELKDNNVAKSKLHLNTAMKYFKDASRNDYASNCATVLALIAHTEKNEPEAKRLEAEAAELKKNAAPAPKQP